MPILYQKWITRDDLRNNRGRFYLFGDNVARKGYGGQAKAMRGEPNAIGIATKWIPLMNYKSFFNDEDDDCRKILVGDLRHVQRLLAKGEVIVVPADGLGTGLSQLPERAPRLALLLDRFFQLYGPIPWKHRATQTVHLSL